MRGKRLDDSKKRYGRGWGKLTPPKLTVEEKKAMRDAILVDLAKREGKEVKKNG